MSVPEELWRQRSKRHFVVVTRYTRDMGRSGFFMFLLFALIALAYFYNTSLSKLSEDFPYTLLLTAVLLPLLAISPVRTLLREADSVFLLPLESRMGAYFRAAFRYSFIGQAILIVVVVTTLSPLYYHGFGKDATPLWVLLFLTVALKFASLLSTWKEASLSRRGQRIASAGFKWVGNAAVLVVFFLNGFLFAALLFLLLFTFASIVYRQLPAYRVHWTELLTREKIHQAYFHLFFSWFTDVEELQSQVKRRKWLSFSIAGVRFRQMSSYVYLYAVTLLRSELTGIIIRLLVIAAILIATSTDPWMASGLYVFFCLVINVQLSALREFHTYAVMPALYPLPAEARLHAQAAVAFRAQLAVIALLTAALAVSPALAPWMALLPPAVLGVAAVVRRRMRKPRA